MNAQSQANVTPAAAAPVEKLTTHDYEFKLIVDLIAERGEGISYKAAVRLAAIINEALAKRGDERIRLDIRDMDAEPATTTLANQPTYAKSKPKGPFKIKEWARLVETIEIGKKGGHAIEGEFVRKSNLYDPDWITKHQDRCIVTRGIDGRYVVMVPTVRNGVIDIAHPVSSDDWRDIERWFQNNEPSLVK